MRFMKCGTGVLRLQGDVHHDLRDGIPWKTVSVHSRSVRRRHLLRVVIFQMVDAIEDRFGVSDGAVVIGVV